MITVPLESRHLSAIAAIEAEQLPNPLNLRNLQELASRPAFRAVSYTHLTLPTIRSV